MFSASHRNKQTQWKVKRLQPESQDHPFSKLRTCNAYHVVNDSLILANLQEGIMYVLKIKF